MAAAWKPIFFGNIGRSEIPLKAPWYAAFGVIVFFSRQSFYWLNSITLAGFDGLMASDTTCD